MKTLAGIGVLALVAVISVQNGSVVVAQAPGHAVFVEIGRSVAVDGLRQIEARTDLPALDTVRRRVGATGAAGIVLPLPNLSSGSRRWFEDTVFNGVIRDTGPTSRGYWLAGHRVGDELSDFTLVVNGRVVVGTVRTPRAVYKIATDGEDRVAIRQIDPAALLREMPPLRDRTRPSAEVGRIQPVMPPLEQSAARVPGGAEDGSRIDILSVYTPTATRLYGGLDAIRAELDLAIADTNQAYASSGVEQRLNLAGAVEVDYTPHPNGSTNVQRLQNPNDGHLDEVHGMRNRVAADFVTLEPGGRNIQGVSFATAARADEAFTSHGISGYGFAHEFGHLQGLHHDRYRMTKEMDRDQDLKDFRPPYAFGYVNQAACKPQDRSRPTMGWKTIMAFFDQIFDQGCEQAYHRISVNRFSNPHQTYLGYPLGVRGTRPSSSITGPSDARRLLNQRRRRVANFRVAPCLRNGTWVRIQASSGEFVVAIDGGGGEVVANRSSPGPWGRFQVIDHNGGCVRSGDPITFKTHGGSYLNLNPTVIPNFIDATGVEESSSWNRFYALLKGNVLRRGKRTGAIRSGDSITLHSVEMSLYIGADQGGGGALLVNYYTDGPWQTFRITNADLTLQ